MAFVTKTIAEDVLDSKRADDFKRIVKRVIDRQLDESNVRRIIRGVPKSERKDSNREQFEEIAEQNENVPPPEPTEEEYAALLAILLWAASQGRSVDESEATREELQQARQETIENLTQRLNVILYGRTANTDAPPPPHIANPNLPNGGGINSAYWIALYIRMAISRLEAMGEDLTEAAILREYERVREDKGQSGETRNEERASLISWEMARASAVGLYFMAKARGAKTKTWLETESKDPRIIHLEQVGVTVPFDGLFPDGSFWSNQLINCKCGIRLGYG